MSQAWCSYLWTGCAVTTDTLSLFTERCAHYIVETYCMANLACNTMVFEKSMRYRYKPTGLSTTP